MQDSWSQVFFVMVCVSCRVFVLVVSFVVLDVHLHILGLKLCFCLWSNSQSLASLRCADLRSHRQEVLSCEL